MDPAGKYWCWTLHRDDAGGYGPSPTDPTANVAIPEDLSDYKTERSTISITYTIAQEEKAPDTGRIHLQGYVEFDHAVHLSWLKKTFNKRIHWERRKGTAKQASDYSEKEDSRLEDGRSWKKGVISNPEQGKRNDLHEVADQVMSGMSMKRIAEEHPVQVIKFARGIQTLIDLVQEVPEDIEKTVIILYGEPGSGKSSWAKRYLREIKESYYCPAMNNAGALSFESYADQAWLLLDDFASGALTAQALKQLTDRYACQLPGRGSSKWTRHHGVIITSNYPIESWFKEPVEAAAIRRRCSQIWICQKMSWRYDGGSQRMPAEKPNPMTGYFEAMRQDKDKQREYVEIDD